MAVISDAALHPASDEPVGHESAEGEGTESLGAILRQRVISIGSMSPRLRLITGFAIAVGIASISATAVQAFPVHFPLVDVYTVHGRLVETPVPVLVLTLAMLIIAWTYLLSGALHAHWVLRFAGLAAFTLVMWNQRTIVAGPGLAAIAAVLLVALWAWGVLTLLWDRRQDRRGNHEKRHGSRVTWTTFGVVLAVVAGLYAVGFVSGSRSGTQFTFTVSLSDQLTVLTILLIPILLVAGVDFAEWGGVVSEHAGRISNRLTSAKLVAVTTAVLAAGIAIHYLWPHRHDVRIIAETLLVGAVVGGVIAVAVWLSGSAHGARTPSVPVFFVVLAAVLFTVVTLLYVYVPPAGGGKNLGSVDASLGTYSFPGTPAFSLQQPTFWDSSTVRQEGRSGSISTIVTFSGANAGDPAAFDVFAVPTARVPDTTTAASVWLQFLTVHGALKGQVAYLTSWTHEHGWDRFDIQTTPQVPGTRPGRGRLWTQVVGDQVWVLVGVTQPGLFGYISPAFDTMAATWAPHTSPVTTAESAPPRVPTTGDQALTLTFGIMLLLAVVSLALARRGLGGRFSGALRTGSLYLLVATVLMIGTGLGSVVSTLTGSDHEWLSLFHLHGIQVVVALSTVIVVLAAGRPRWRRLRRFVGPLFALNVALIIVALFIDLYATSDGVAQFTVLQAVVLLVAFALDVVLSGESFTNAHSEVVPRHARVLMFFGYILLGSALVLYFSSLHYQGTGGPVPSQFEEGWPQMGLIIFGIPLVLTVFILKVLRTPDATPSDGARQEPAVHGGAG